MKLNIEWSKNSGRFTENGKNKNGKRYTIKIFEEEVVQEIAVGEEKIDGGNGPLIIKKEVNLPLVIIRVSNNLYQYVHEMKF